MKILLINKFLYLKGGDAVSTLNTGRIFEDRGHQVDFWGMAHPDNPAYTYQSFFVPQIDYENAGDLRAKINTACNILYSFPSKKKLGALLKILKPNVVHLNNFAHQISPSVLDVIKSHKIPIVMTMHDYKMVCPTYKLLCNNQVCERCKRGRFYNCGIHQCTKGSLFKSLVNVAEMYLHHRMLNIYDKVDIYISPSLFLQKKVIEMGLKGRIAYLPNCVELKEFTPRFQWTQKSIVYVGRLSQEKGVETLMDAVNDIDINLKIIGQGPQSEYLKKKKRDQGMHNIDFLGHLSGKSLQDEIRNSMFLITPSQWYENNPLTVIEAFALGKPVIGARIGGIPELVEDWTRGLTFAPGNVPDLRDKILLLLENEDKIPQMGKAARQFVEQNLNSDVYYDNLLKIYEYARNNTAN